MPRHHAPRSRGDFLDKCSLIWRFASADAVNATSDATVSARPGEVEEPPFPSAELRAMERQ
jgi:hypothetical protein